MGGQQGGYGGGGYGGGGGGYGQQQQQQQYGMQQQGGMQGGGYGMQATPSYGGGQAAGYGGAGGGYGQPQSAPPPAALPGAWTEHKTDEGVSYWYNSASGVSQVRFMPIARSLLIPVFFYLSLLSLPDA
ncbi:hypothetical protein B484DRAFT_436107 [Ochromonadaceae sp. CCMP2298]|nr:hypothetical protein B484DRAFT_436107 [Ochromonadaceae sp. CCMP2298]